MVVVRLCDRSALLASDLLLVCSRGIRWRSAPEVFDGGLLAKNLRVLVQSASSQKGREWFSIDVVAGVLVTRLTTMKIV